MIDPQRWAWGHEYDELRQAGYSWRVAAYIAWASSPVAGRTPKTQGELATEVLGLASGNVIHRWKKKDPTIEETIFKMQSGPLMSHRRDAFDALVRSATNDDANRTGDRRLFFTMTNDLVESSKQEIKLNNVDVAKLTDAELEAIIASRDGDD